MRRAAVLVGVGRHPKGPLHAVQPGLDALATWAAEQGFAQVETLTDDPHPLTVRTVLDTITGIVRASATDQLLVYFAGHGVNVGRREFWLLSDAPEIAHEAVDVRRSADFAETCGIPHVVLVSDACRTAASGIGMQEVSGSPVFPNVDLGGPEGFVDRFHACALGSPSHEVATVEEAVERYHAVYTDALVEALRGEAEPALVREGTVALVRPWPLRGHLEQEVGRRLARLVPEKTLTQIPGAKINSPPESWLARIEDAPPESRPRGGDAPPDGLSTVVGRAVHEHLDKGFDGPATPLLSAAESDVPGARELLEASLRIAEPFPDPGFDRNGSGLVVRGAAIADAATEEFVAPPRPVGPDRSAVAVQPTVGSLPVLAEFDDGTGVVLPVVRGYVTEVTVEEREVVDVAFEPVWLRTDPERRALRALVSVASRFGVFTVPPDDVDALIGAAFGGGVVDPTLALLTAYALSGTPQRDRIDQMEARLGRTQLLDAFPDLSLLSGRSRPIRTVDVPLLAEGAFLRPGPDDDPDPPGPDLRSHLAPSMWTQLTGDGVGIVRDARFPRGFG